MQKHTPNRARSNVGLRISPFQANCDRLFEHGAWGSRVLDRPGDVECFIGARGVSASEQPPSSPSFFRRCFALQVYAAAPMSFAAAPAAADAGQFFLCYWTCPFSAGCDVSFTVHPFHQIYVMKLTEDMQYF